MDTFDEWVKTADQYPCLQEWGETVAALGASWDSFRRNKKDITDDLVHGGIHMLAARDIVDIASREIKRRTLPMAIFWDLENMSIPAGIPGRDIVGRIKTILAPHGDITQFRGYASIGLNLIPQEKRSDLQLSGCHLVDCPHSGRKEVADKMIIVDAMQFAYEHPDGATLCFITGDVDYAYLLAVLQRHPEWRTIVISHGTMQSMLHANCHTKMRWETDILLPIYDSLFEVEGKDLTEEDASILDAEGKNPTEEHYVLGALPLKAEGKNLAEEDDILDALPLEAQGKNLTDENGIMAAPLNSDEDTPKRQQDSRSIPSIGDKFCRDDVELLKRVMIQEGQRYNTNTPRKSQVGCSLRQTYPARFPDKKTIRSFFVQALEKEIISEHGKGAFKTLILSDRSNASSGEVWLKPSKNLPLVLPEWPKKAVQVARDSRPFVLLIRKINCPSGYQLPGYSFIQSTDNWLLLLYSSHNDVLRSANEYSWLRSGILVDWRQLDNSICTVCGVHFQIEHSEVTSKDDSQHFCSPQCIVWNVQDRTTKQAAVGCTVQALRFMEDNDDIYVAKNLLQKILYKRNPELCSSSKYTRLWIIEAISAGKIVSFKRPENSKNSLICLPENLDEALQDFPPSDFDTSREEKFLYGLLWSHTNTGGLDRRFVAKELREKFPDRMYTQLRRNKALRNAHANGLLNLCKGPFLHIVGLTRQHAEAAMAIEENKLKKQRERST